MLHLQGLLQTYDVVAVQEANIPEPLFRAYSRLLREAGMQARFGDTEHIGDEAARQARTLTATSSDRVILNTQVEDADLLHLQRSDDGRKLWYTWTTGTSSSLLQTTTGCRMRPRARQRRKTTKE